MKVATHEQVKNIEISREVIIFLNLSEEYFYKMPLNGKNENAHAVPNLLWNTKEDIFNNVLHTMNVKKKSRTFDSLLRSFCILSGERNVFEEGCSC